MPQQIMDLSGRRFGRLVVVRFHSRSEKRTRFSCLCDCGNEPVVRADTLLSGSSTSCGCLRQRQRPKLRPRNGRSSHPDYQIWSSMIGRCYSPRHTSYQRYGGRGITVCERWRTSFEAFISDMGSRPSLKHSVDRIDTNGSYEPSNCRWATVAEQANNTRGNHRITAFGETLTLSQWSRKFGVKREAIAGRLLRGWHAECAVSAPTHQRRAYAKHWRAERAKAAA